MSEIEQLKQKVAHLENLLNLVIKNDRYSFTRTVEFNTSKIKMSPKTTISCPGADVGEGLKIGASPTDLIGFFGVDPVWQQPGVAVPTISIVTGSGADVAINNNFSNIQSTFEDLLPIFTSLGLTT